MKRSVQKSKILFLKTKTNFFKNSFFPAVILEWNNLDVNIRNSASCNFFKRVILKFTRPEPNQVFNVDSSEGLKFLTRIRLGLSHLAYHKFRHNFQDCVNPVCSCGQEIETSTHFLLEYCSCFSQLSLLVLLYFSYFSVLLLLLKYVNMSNLITVFAVKYLLKFVCF